jgi:hypothetical protein
MKYLKTFEAMSYEEIDIEKGDLVFCENEGHNGLVGLVTTDVYTNDDNEQVVDVHFRGYNGDILSESIEDITIIDEDNLYLLDEKSDYIQYKKIAEREGLQFNSYKYEEYFDGNIEESKTNENNQTSTIEKGDLVFCKCVGDENLIGLVISDVHPDEDIECDECVDVYFKDIDGDIYSVELDDIIEINDENINSINDSDIEEYKTIAEDNDYKFNIYKYEK